MYTNTSSPMDAQAVETFLKKVVSDTSGLAVTLMAAFGDRFGLFKDLASNGPATGAELAGRAGIHSRYAQEWLQGMFSAGYVSYDPISAQFALPPEGVPVLAQEGSPQFVGGTHQMLLGMLKALNHLEQAFQDGGGIPMSAYDSDTWEGMERDMNGVYLDKLIHKWIPAMPQVKELLHRGIRVADIGCGSGRTLILMAKAYPQSRFIGYDQFAPAIHKAMANAQEAGVADRVDFILLDGIEGLPEQYDLITTFEVIHDSADPFHLLKAIRNGLTPGGRYVCMDINCSDRLEENTGPLAALRYGFSLLYCMSTSLASGGVGLGTMGLPETKMRALCLEAGFSELHRVPLDDAVHNVYEALP